MENKRDIIYHSSQEALIKIYILILTLGISIFASLIDYKSCYITIIVQAINNMYDFYKFTDNKQYSTVVKRESIAIMICSIIAIIISIIALLMLYKFMQFIWIKLLVISLVTLPLAVVHSDYKMNVEKENELEM